MFGSQTTNQMATVRYLFMPLVLFIFTEDKHQKKLRFPPELENRENLEKWESILQSGKSQGILFRLEKSGNFTQNTGKLWKMIKLINLKKNENVYRLYDQNNFKPGSAQYM